MREAAQLYPRRAALRYASPTADSKGPCLVGTQLEGAALFADVGADDKVRKTHNLCAAETGR